MEGQVSPRILRIQSLISGLQLQTLADSGSTHNFMQERVAKFLELPIQPSTHFIVLVSNGQTLMCEGFCPKVCIILRSENFYIGFYDLNQWLAHLGRIAIDYTQMYMEFTWEGRLVRLQGDPLL